MDEEKYEERLKRIEKLQKEGYVSKKSQSLVLNNIYSLITIVIVSLAILIYINFIYPLQEKEKLKALKEQQRIEHFKERARQIELSRKLNATQEGQDDNNTSN